MLTKGSSGQVDPSRMAKLAVVFMLVASSACAASDDETAIRSTFVKPWIEATRSKDKAAVRRLYHPAMRACMNSSSKRYFDFLLNLEMQNAEAGGYHVSRIVPARTLPPEADVRYPVRPTYEFHLDAEKGSPVIFIRFLAPSNGSWYEVLPCPTKKK